jgi:hypothetical protein
MKVPNIEEAIVPREKIAEYLLSFTHPRGREKARFFRRFGFSRDEWEVFAAALREHARAHEVSEVTTTVRGTQYRVEGALGG